MTKLTIVYGGAFNPPTVAHQAILSRLCAEAHRRGADVWLLPSGERSDKEIKVTHARRREYLKALIADANTGHVVVTIDESELARSSKTETIDTVRDFEARWPDRHFLWVFGTDSVLTMHEWRSGEYLLGQIDKLIVSRPGYELGVLPPRSTFLRVKTPQISSTLLRQHIEGGLSYAHLVSPHVAKVIAATMKS